MALVVIKTRTVHLPAYHVRVDTFRSMLLSRSSRTSPLAVARLRLTLMPPRRHHGTWRRTHSRLVTRSVHHALPVLMSVSWARMSVSSAKSVNIIPIWANHLVVLVQLVSSRMKLVSHHATRVQVDSLAMKLAQANVIHARSVTRTNRVANRSVPLASPVPSRTRLVLPHVSAVLPVPAPP